MSLQLVYETHAITTDNEAGIATGWLPGTLSARGRETAVELGRRRREDGLAAIYVSDLARAIETVSVAFARSAIPVVTEARLRECNYGTLNGMPVSVLERERSLHVHDPWPGGESYVDVVQRTRQCLAELADQWRDSRILLVGHSANKWALDHLLLDRDLVDLLSADFQWQEGWEYLIPTGWPRTVQSSIHSE